MNLFSKDKELILKLTNAALLIWLLAAIIFLISNLTDLLIKEPLDTYETYSNKFCLNDTVKEKEEIDCKQTYKTYISNEENNDFYTIKSTIVSAANVVLVSITLLIINKEKNIRKK